MEIRKVGKSVGGITISHSDEIAKILPQRNIQMAILAIPADRAQQVANVLSQSQCACHFELCADSDSGTRRGMGALHRPDCNFAQHDILSIARRIVYWSASSTICASGWCFFCACLAVIVPKSDQWW
jgi:hypothetical protein